MIWRLLLTKAGVLQRILLSVGKSLRKIVLDFNFLAQTCVYQYLQNFFKTLGDYQNFRPFQSTPSPIVNIIKLYKLSTFLKIYIFPRQSFIFFIF